MPAAHQIVFVHVTQSLSLANFKRMHDASPCFETCQHTNLVLLCCCVHMALCCCSMLDELCNDVQMGSVQIGLSVYEHITTKIGVIRIIYVCVRLLCPPPSNDCNSSQSCFIKVASTKEPRRHTKPLKNL